MIRYLNPNRYTKVSRYAKLRLIQSNKSELPYLEVVNPTPDVPVQECELFTVTGPYIDRLDLIAEKYYGAGMSHLWWYIAKQNHLEDPTKVPIDTVLQIPRYTSLLEDGRVLEPMSYIDLNLGVDE